MNNIINDIKALFTRFARHGGPASDAESAFHSLADEVAKLKAQIETGAVSAVSGLDETAQNLLKELVEKLEAYDNRLKIVETQLTELSKAPVDPQLGQQSN